MQKLAYITVYAATSDNRRYANRPAQIKKKRKVRLLHNVYYRKLLAVCKAWHSRPTLFTSHSPIMPNFDFPIVVAFFLRVRLEAKIKCTSAEIEELEKTIGKII
jgi:hypothetical protein